MKKQIVLATGNEGKIREFVKMLDNPEIEIKGINSFPGYEAPDETGKTFAENALIKARYASSFTGLPAMADDSGLEVDALYGRPGIYSARFAGADADDEKNNRKLIRYIRNVPAEKRTCRYVCAAALVFPDGKEYTSRGTVEGLIVIDPRGTEGFGYDPYFYLPKLGKTFAEIAMEEKNRISHRGRALEGIRKYLEQ